MNKQYITIAETQYLTTKEEIDKIALKGGFVSVRYVVENISGRFRQGYFKAYFVGNFRCFAEKLRASVKVKEDLNKLEVV
jgi:hypothetical protein